MAHPPDPGDGLLHGDAARPPADAAGAAHGLHATIIKDTYDEFKEALADQREIEGKL